MQFKQPPCGHLQLIFLNIRALSTQSHVCAGKSSFNHIKNCEHVCNSACRVVSRVELLLQSASCSFGDRKITELSENMVEMHTGPYPSLEIHNLVKKWSSEVKEIKLKIVFFYILNYVMYGVQSRRFWVWLSSWCCWSDRVKDASDSPQTPGSPSGEQPATHAVVTHHSWQRRRVRARRCGGNIITKTILSWHLPPLLWRKMGKNKHSQREK